MKISVIGTGFVGASIAYSLVLKGVGSEIVLVDINKEKAKAEAEDILHSAPFSYPINVRAGEYSDLVDSEIVLLAAGVNQAPGETRLQLLDRNKKIFESIIPSVMKYAPHAVFIVVTNPVDILTFVTIEIAKKYNKPTYEILGSGTILDTARFRALLSEHLGVGSNHVHAYVLGEHGDSEVLAWSNVSVGGIPLSKLKKNYGPLTPIDEAAKKEIDHQVRYAAYEIIKHKGATYYGIGAGAASLADAILRDRKALLTVSNYNTSLLDQPICISTPCLLGKKGIRASLPVSLDDDENKLLIKSAEILRKTIADLGYY